MFPMMKKKIETVGAFCTKHQDDNKNDSATSKPQVTKNKYSSDSDDEC